MIDRLPIGVYVCEAPSGVIRFYNNRAAELWGREPRLGDTDERFCGSLRLFRLDGAPLPHDATPMAEVLRGGGRRIDEVVIERPDGSRVTVSVDITPLLEADGRVVGAVNAFQDVTARKTAEQALRLSEARYRAIVEDQPEMVCRFLPDGTMTFANAAYCAYFGFDAEELRGRRYVPVVHPDDFPRVQELVSSLGAANRTVTIDNRVFRADGAVRWTVWTNHAICDEQGRVLEFQSTGRDITEQRRAEEDSARLAAIVAGADDAIIGKTLDGVITSWNRAAEALFGWSAAEAIGRPITLIIPPERCDEERGVFERLRRGETLQHFETLRVTKEGSLVPVSLSFSLIRDAAGRVAGASTIARDMRERRRAEEALRQSVQSLEVLYRLADLIGRAPGAKEVCEAAVDAIMNVARADRASVLVFDERGVMRFVAWRGLSDGYRSAVDGHSPWTPDARDPEPILVEDAANDPGLGELREVIAAEGIRALGFIPLSYQGRLLGKFMVYYDAPHVFTAEELRLAATVAQHVGFGLTRVRAEQEIEQLLARERAARQEADGARAESERASRAKDEFLAMLAHELRNPVGVIVNAIAILEGNGSLPAELRRASGIMQRQAEHLARLLDDLLDVARITSGRIELEREPLDLRVAVELALEAQRHRLEAKRQRLNVEVPERPVTVIGDRVRLQQVLGNLVNNASKYTPAGGAISMSLEPAGGEALLRVRDDGAGIPPDRLEAIFELFAQANPTLARTEGGLGIGLTLVRKVVELHGGSVRAASEGPDRGAEFTVRLPLAAAARAETRPSHDPLAATPRRILVIEDHEDGREMLVATLQKYGHQVLEAATGREGIDVASRHRPEVVLVDIGLPDIEGYVVGHELRRRLGRGVHLVALTGYGQPEDRARSREAGFDVHLVKPVEPPKLAETLERLARSTPA